MFQKHSMLSLKKKSKSLGHLTAINQFSPYSPEQQPKVKKNGGGDFSFHSGGGWTAGGANTAGRSRLDSVQPANNAAKYMKRFLSPVSYDRDPLRDSNLRSQDGKTNHRQDKQQQTSKKTTPKKLKGVMKNKNGGVTTNVSSSPGGGLSTSGTSGPMAMGKALISRNFSPQKINGNRSHSTGSHAGVAVDDLFQGKGAATSLHGKHRVFIIDTQVKYTVGVQMQERNLFLFNDLLLIAKERSSSHFKLKDQVPLSDVWLSDCISDVCEVTLDPTTSFVIGWPITNAVLTFRTREEKESWWARLQDLVLTEREHTATGASICITYFDTNTNFEHVKNIYVSRSDSAQDCIRKALTSLPIMENGDIGNSASSTTSDNNKNTTNSSDVIKACDTVSPHNTPSKVVSAFKKAGEDEGGGGIEGGGERTPPSDYQLWVKTKFDESPYPLIGHEIPLVIKLNFMRQAFNSKKGNSYDDYRRCTFILRKVGQVNNFSQAGSQKKKLKKVKSSIKLQNVFRRVSGVTVKSTDSVDAASSSPINQSITADKKAGKLFGRKLDELFGASQDPANMPQPIKAMLIELEEKGPSTLGIFRRGPNVRAMREIREQLDEFDPSAAPLDGESGVDIGSSCSKVDWSQISVFVTAALLKDFLRSLPDCLLQSDNYNSWIQANTNSDIKALNSYIKSLPVLNQYVLHHLLYVLYKTSQSSEENMMTSSNLSICVGPSILWTQDPHYSLDPAYTKEVSGLLETLIDNYTTLYENNTTPQLFNNQSKPTNRGGYDHSSLDSLLDPAGPEEELNRQNGIEGVSLTNLSQDSGLTTSDSQLYNAWEDDEYSSEDFTIERISSNQNTVHAIINKKYLSRYHNNHPPNTTDIRRGGSDGPGSTFRSSGGVNGNGGESPPQGGSGGGRKQNRRHQKNRDRMHRRIHRSADYSAGMDPHADTSAASESFNSPAVRSDSLCYPPLRRTASEESIQYHQQPQNNSDIIQISTNKKNVRPRSGGPRKARAPIPPKGGNSVIRSNSVNQVRDWESRKDWYRSKSTTLIHSDEEEGNNSCSTLSDEDSTPHVSRSNSYGRAEEPGGGQGDPNYPGGHHHQQRGHFDGGHHHQHGGHHHHHHEVIGGHHHELMYPEDDTTYDIYLHDDRTLNLETNLEAALSNNISRDKHIKDVDNLSCETPPGYEESIYRQRLLKLQQGHSTSSGYHTTSSDRSSNNKHLPDRSILEEQEHLSAKAKAVFEASLRQYNGEASSNSSTSGRMLYNGGESLVDILDGVDPPPLPPKTDRPPLPPKQRSRRSAEPDSGSDDQTYVNSADILRPGYQVTSARSSAGSRTRLTINSPVQISTNNSATTATSTASVPPSNSISLRNHDQQLPEQMDSSQFVYGSYFSSGAAGIISQDSSRVSVPVIQDPSDSQISRGQTTPPLRITTPPLLPPKDATTPVQQQGKKLRQVTSTKIGSTSKVMCSVETQTDESDFMIVYPEEGEEMLLEDVGGGYGNHTDSEYSPEESNRSLSPDIGGPIITGLRHSSFDYSGVDGNRSLSPVLGGSYLGGKHSQLYSPHFGVASHQRDLYSSHRPVSSQSRDHELREASRRTLVHSPSLDPHTGRTIFDGSSTITTTASPVSGVGGVMVIDHLALSQHHQQQHMPSHLHHRSNRISVDSTSSSASSAAASHHRLLVGGAHDHMMPVTSSAVLAGSRAASVTAETTVSSHSSSSGSGGSAHGGSSVDPMRGDRTSSVDPMRGDRTSSVDPLRGSGASSSVDPLIAGEINWSVSQLRSLFNQGLVTAAQHNQINNHPHINSGIYGNHEYNTNSSSPYPTTPNHPNQNSHGSASPYPLHHTYAAYPATAGDSGANSENNRRNEQNHASGGRNSTPNNRLRFNGVAGSGNVSGLPRYYPNIQQQRHFGEKGDKSAVKTLFMAGSGSTGGGNMSGQDAESDQESYV